MKLFEVLITLFLTAVLIVCIISAYNDSYPKSTDKPNEPAEETNIIDNQNNSVSTTEDAGDIKGRTPVMEAPLVENDYNPGGSFIGTVMEETTQYMIVEPIKTEEHSLSDRVTVVYPQEHIDYLYGIGSKVYINYAIIEPNTPYIKIITDDIKVVSE